MLAYDGGVVTVKHVVPTKVGIHRHGNRDGSANLITLGADRPVESTCGQVQLYPPGLRARSIAGGWVEQVLHRAGPDQRSRG